MAAAQTSKYYSVPQGVHRHLNVTPANFKPAMLCRYSGSLLKASGLLSEEDVDLFPFIICLWPIKKTLRLFLYFKSKGENSSSLKTEVVFIC